MTRQTANNSFNFVYVCVYAGEMERDACLAHGSSFTIQDRLHLSSDSISIKVCTLCRDFAAVVKNERGKYVCCEHSFAGSSCIEIVKCPQSLRVLLEELRALHIHIDIFTQKICNERY